MQLAQRVAATTPGFRETYDRVEALCAAASGLGPMCDQLPEGIEACEALQAAMAARHEAGADFCAGDDVLVAPLQALLAQSVAALDKAGNHAPVRVIRHLEAQGAWAAQHGDLDAVPWGVFLAGLVAHVGSGDESTATQFLLERLMSPTGSARCQFHIDRGNSGTVSVCDVDVAFPPGHMRMRDRLRLFLDTPPDKAPAVGRLRSNVPDGTALYPAPELLHARDGDDVGPNTVVEALCTPKKVKSSVGLMTEVWPSTWVVLYGTHGMGKTSLARVVATRCLNQAAAFPGGVYFVDMHSRKTRPGWGSALACALGCPVVGSPDPETAAMVALRGGGARNRTLVFLDACDAALDTKDVPTRTAFLAMLKRMRQLGDHICVVITTLAPLEAADAARAQLVDGAMTLRVGPLPLKTCTDALASALPPHAELLLDPALSRRHAKEAAQLAGRSPLAMAVLVPALRALAPVQKGKAMETLLHTLRLARGAQLQGDEFNKAGPCCEATCVNPWSNLAELLAPSLYFNMSADVQQAKAEALAEEKAAMGRGVYNAATEHAEQPTVTGLSASTYAGVQKACAAFALAALTTPTEDEHRAAALASVSADGVVPENNPQPGGDVALVAACALSVISGSFTYATARHVAASLPGGWAIRDAPQMQAALGLLLRRSLLLYDPMCQRYSMPEAVRAAARELPAGVDITAGATAAWIRGLVILVDEAQRDVDAGAPAPGLWATGWEEHALEEATSQWAEAGAPDAVTRALILQLRDSLAKLTALKTAASSDAPVISAADVEADVGAAMDRLRAHAEECAAGGRGEDAVDAYAQLMELQRTAVGGYDPSLADTHAAMAACYMQSSLAAEAAEALEKALAIQVLTKGPDDPAVGSTLVSLCTARRALGETEAAQSAARRGLLVLSTVYGSEHPQVATAQVALGDISADAGQLEAALNSYRLAARTLDVAAGGEPCVEGGHVAFGIAQVYLRQGKFADAEKEAKRAAELFAQFLGADDPLTRTAQAMGVHGGEQIRQQDGGDPAWEPHHQGHPWNRWETGL
jgi:tetratricopeptide (TPR) repeat protein